jgi:iron complex outermembrane receptor protein
MSRKGQLVSTSAISLACLLCAVGPGFAQVQPPAKEGKGIEQVVVTARKRNERLQKVPVAVTALSATQLAQNKIVNVDDLGQVVPSLTFQTSSYSPFGALVGIRGQKTEDTILSETPSIGIYVDNVYAPSTIGTGIGNLYDTSSVEVLKGPQGTLYGRNTTGGAVKITSNLPDYSGFYGSVKVGFGNYDSNEDALMLNVPIVQDKVALRIVLERDYHGGYAHDDANDRPVDDADARSGRFALRLDPMEDLNIMVRGNWSDGRSGGGMLNLEEIKPVFGPGGVPTFSPALLNVGLETGAIPYSALLPLLAPQYYGPPTAADIGAVIAGQEAAYKDLQRYLRTGYTDYYGLPEFARTKDDGASIDATYNYASWLSLKSITSYQFAAQAASADESATPYAILQGIADQTALDQFTQEFQVSGRLLDDRLNYTGGLYYYHLSGNDDSPYEQELPFLNTTGSPVNARDHLYDTSRSAYGQVTYAIIPSVHVTGGIRYTDEHTELHATSTDGPANACDLPPPYGLNGVACSAIFKNGFTNLSYTGGIDWQVTDTSLLYFSTSRGFKAGGQNQRGDTLGGFASFAPEIVTNYEIGEKSDFLDHRLRLNIAAYHSIYTNIQRSVLAVLPGDQTVTEIQNAAAATIDGVEIEATAKPVDWLLLGANSAYTMPKYTRYVSDGVSLAGNAFQDQPQWQINLSATYFQPVTLGNLPANFTGTVSFSYQSSVDLSPDNLTVYSNNYPNQPGYGLLNARLALDIPKYKTTLEFWGKNLTNRKYLVGDTDVTSALGVGIAEISDPLTFGFDVIKRF